MLIPNQGSCSERLRYYGTKCQQHLTRVRLSHVLSLRALEAETRSHDSAVNELVRASFDDPSPNILDGKLRLGLNEVHLAALKADFELFLNRVLTVVWTAHFERLGEHCPKGNVALREVAEAAAQRTTGRDFVVQTVVPKHNLESLARTLQETTSIELSENLTGYDFSRWSQVFVAFQVRHLVEHCDGRADAKFRRQARKHWRHSTWGRREPDLDSVEKIRVEGVDVESTYAAMRDAARLLTVALVKWDAAQPVSLSRVGNHTSA